MRRDVYPPGQGVCLIRDTVGRSMVDSRISFGIVYYEDANDAQRATELTKEEGNRYNGGVFHGMPCGREECRDFTDDDGTLWLAVTY